MLISDVMTHAVRAGDLDLAQRVTAEVAKGAIPEFFFHRRGG